MRARTRLRRRRRPLWAPKKMPNEGRVCAPWRLRKKSACVRACVCVGVARKACACKRIRFIIEGVTVLHAPHGPLFVRPQREHFVCVCACVFQECRRVTRCCTLCKYCATLHGDCRVCECVCCVVMRSLEIGTVVIIGFLSPSVENFLLFCVSDTDNNICADFPV